MVAVKAPVKRAGTLVRVERDEVKYPPRGSWPQFRNRQGTVVTVNHDEEHPHLTEYGVVFGTVYRRPNGWLRGASDTVWFLEHELTALPGKAEVVSAAD